MTVPASGPGGLNHDHNFNSELSLNGKSLALPRVVLDPQGPGITGLFDLPDTADPREKRTAAIGEAIYPDRPGGKTVVYKGELQARNELELNLLRQTVRGTLAKAMSDEKPILITPHASFGDDTWSYLARIPSGGLQINEEVYRSKNHPLTPYARNFQLTLRMSDPRFYLFSDYIETEMTDADDYLTLVNYDAPADPIFTVNLPTPGSTVDIKSNTVDTPSGDARLRFGGMVGDPMPGGGGLQLIVDFREGGRTAKFSDGANAMHWFDSAYSNWWDEFIDGLAPGSNEVTTSGGGQWKVEYWPRCW